MHTSTPWVQLHMLCSSPSTLWIFYLHGLDLLLTAGQGLSFHSQRTTSHMQAKVIHVYRVQEAALGRFCFAINDQICSRRLHCMTVEMHKMGKHANLTRVSFRRSFRRRLVAKSWRDLCLLVPPVSTKAVPGPVQKNQFFLFWQASNRLSTRKTGPRVAPKLCLWQWE